MKAHGAFKSMDTVAVWLFLLALSPVGSYGLWHSTTAAEFTAREINPGFAKYRYRPKWYHRAIHFTVSLMFRLIALAGIARLLR